MASLKSGIIFLTKTGIDVYVSGHDDVLHYVFPQVLVQDIEVVNREELVNQITLFLQTNEITEVSFNILVYDDILFSKEFKNESIEQQADEIKSFISTVPFEYTLSKQIKNKESVTVIATNATLIESIMQAFQKNNCLVTFAGISYLALQGIDLTNGFTKDVAATALKKNEQIKQYSFFAEEKRISRPKNEENTSFIKNPKNKRAVVLSVVFIILIGLLIAVYFMTNANQEPIDPVIPASEPAQTAPPDATPTVIITNPADARIQIRTTNTQSFGQLQTSLNALNFEIIELDTENTSIGTTTTVLFDPSISPSLQQNVLQILRASDPNVVSQTSPVSTHHIVITLPQ